MYELKISAKEYKGYNMYDVQLAQFHLIRQVTILGLLVFCYLCYHYQALEQGAPDVGLMVSRVLLVLYTPSQGLKH